MKPDLEHPLANPRFDDSGSGELLDKRESGSIWAAVIAPLVCLLLGWNAPAIYSAIRHLFN